jgi:cytochrome c553
MCKTCSFARALIITFVSAAFVAAAEAHAQSPLEDIVHNCNVCHGANGHPRDPRTPIIWGQNQGYIYIQLRDYKNGVRQDESMSDVAADLTRDDMMAVAEYYAQKPWPNLAQPSAPKDVATQALRANASIGCTGCHLDNYIGAGTQPRLAGQVRDYLQKTMTDFRSRARGNNPGMTDLMNATASSDITALAQYLAGL